MRKIIYLLILMGMLAAPLTASACDRYLTEYIRYMREIKDLRQFEREEPNKWMKNKYRNDRLKIIRKARLAHGNYIHCFRVKQLRYRRKSYQQQRQFQEEQKMAVEDTAENYGLDPDEALDMVFRNILPRWAR